MRPHSLDREIVLRRDFWQLVERNCTFLSSVHSFSTLLLICCMCVAFRTALTVHTATSCTKWSWRVMLPRFRNSRFSVLTLPRFRNPQITATLYQPRFLYLCKALSTAALIISMGIVCSNCNSTGGRIGRDFLSDFFFFLCFPIVSPVSIITANRRY
jgi:hypothetical protein